MDMVSLHFLLVPDRAAARKVRRAVAERLPSLNVSVGTWTELMEVVADSYLLSKEKNDWSARVGEAMHAMPDAFWAESLINAPQETIGVIAANLEMLVEGTAPDTVPEAGNLSDRASRHVQDLRSLRERLNPASPPELALIQKAFAIPPDEALRTIRVYRLPDLPRLKVWQEALLAKLDGDSTAPPNESYVSLLEEVLNVSPEEASPKSLLHIQNHLFSAEGRPVPLEDGVQWIAARDALEEVEVVAGMIQHRLGSGGSVTPAGFGVLTPNEPTYIEALSEVFERAGLPLSGLPERYLVRDLGGEAVRHFLMTQQGPTPATAVASLLSSPLMPWKPEDGNRLVQAIMRGNFKLEPLWGMDATSKEMLGLIRGTAPRCSRLMAKLAEFVGHLNSDDQFGAHVESARVCIEGLSPRLVGEGEPPWEELRAAVPVVPLATEGEPVLTREGIAVFLEHEEPWRKVDELFVLGFSSGHYPSSPAMSPVFSSGDLRALKEGGGLDLETLDDVFARRRALFLRQLRAVRNSLTVLIPRRAPDGSELAPSESLTFMAKLFTGIDEPEEVVLDLDSSDDRETIVGLALAEAGQSALPRALEVRDLGFKRDLLLIKTDKEGNAAPESPSNLETLMVSPLAWLLRKVNAEPKPWAPEKMTPLIQGNLAHEVFEHLFPKGGQLPPDEEIPDLVRRHFTEAIRLQMPLLVTATWQVERRHLEREIVEAARCWKGVLEKTGAKVVDAEGWLGGSLGEIAIHGKTDCLLELPDGSLVVVDYKKSGSGRRRESMSRGFDSQTSLYKTMLTTGGNKPGKSSDEDVSFDIPDASKIGVVYFMMNDGIALSDGAVGSISNATNLQVLTGDISANAMSAIHRRLKEVRGGTVLLNKAEDEQYFEKQAGIHPYALDNSPLIRLFMHPSGEEEALP
jgi:ATP-dependent helicase/nuclease subunit B